METRVSRKTVCQRPALKEKLVTDEGDLLGLAPLSEAAASEEEVETEEEEEALFPTKRSHGGQKKRFKDTLKHNMIKCNIG